MKGSNNPEARRRTIDLLHEKGQTLVDWVEMLVRKGKQSRKEVIDFGVKRGFLDEEMEGAWIDYQTKSGDSAK